MNENSIIESEEQIEEFIKDSKAILIGEHYQFDILPKKKDEDPEDPMTTENTMSALDYDSEDVKNHIINLNIDQYIETIKDNKNLSLPPFRVFGAIVNGREVYIKFKIKNKDKKQIFCVSFHFARRKLKKSPYVMQP